MYNNGPGNEVGVGAKSQESCIWNSSSENEHSCTEEDSSLTLPVESNNQNIVLKMKKQIFSFDADCANDNTIDILGRLGKKDTGTYKVNSTVPIALQDSIVDESSTRETTEIKKLQKIVKICEKHVIGQMNTTKEILALCSKIKSNKSYCNQIVNLCNQVFSETLNSSNIIINLCKSLTNFDISDEFEKFNVPKKSQLTNTFKSELNDKIPSKITKNVPIRKNRKSSPVIVQNIRGDITSQTTENKVPNLIPKSIIFPEDVDHFDEKGDWEEQMSDEAENGNSDPNWGGIKTNAGIKKSVKKANSEIYTCSFCGKPYKTKSSFIKHEKSHQDDNSLSMIDEVDDPHLSITNSEKSNVESNCTYDQELVHESDLTEQKGLSETENKISPNSELFHCSICGKSFDKEISCIRHKANHKHKREISQAVQCTYCEKVLKNNSKLILHLRTHTGERPFICEVCGATFSRKCGLVEHQAIHSEDKPFSCPHCDYTCRTQKILKHHLIVHSKEKRYQCDECGKRFSRGKDLKHHLYTHSGIKPYSCDICQRRFIRKCQMQRHQRIHDNDMQFSCEICGKRSRQSYNITVHMRTHTGHKPFSCEKCGNKFAHNVTLRQHRTLCAGLNQIRAFNI